ncbi:MAG: c-type cytochrome [Telluria sp.]
MRAPRRLLALALLALAACGERPPNRAVAGDAARGRIALAQYACHSCHIIPGLTGPRVFVGRSLEGLGKRKFIAGHLPNTQENLMRWIRDPQAVDPQTPMPMLEVTETDARDMSAYLLNLR